MIFLQTDPSILTSIAPVLLNQANKTSFSSIEINLPLSAPQSTVDQIQVQEPILVAVINQVPDPTLE